MSAKNTKTGLRIDANRLPAKWWVHAPKTYSQKKYMKRLTPEQLHARLIVFIGCTLALVFAFSVLGMLYALIFVTQPITNQAPNDRAFIDLLTTLTIFLTGSLGGVLASNGLKSKPKVHDEEIKP
jgi:ABC-type Fe3+ transport system permease subunit